MSQLAVNLRLPPALLGARRYLRPALLALLVIYIAWRLSVLTWLLVPHASTAPVASQPKLEHRAPASAVNVDAIALLHLFGKYEEAAPEQVAAPTTDLALTLRGVYADDDTARANAIIEANGQQGVYFVGERLPGGANASLKQVLPDRVIIDRGGRLETLYLVQDGDASTITLVPAGAETESSGQVIDRRRDVGLQKTLMDVRGKLASNPLSLMKLIAAQPVKENGQTIGYRVSPGADPALFNRAGLRRNDIITAINGVPLSDPSQLPALMQQVQTAANLNVVVRRGHDQLSLLLGTGAEPPKAEDFPRDQPPPVPDDMNNESPSNTYMPSDDR